MITGPAGLELKPAGLPAWKRETAVILFEKKPDINMEYTWPSFNTINNSIMPPPVFSGGAQMYLKER